MKVNATSKILIFEIGVIIVSLAVAVGVNRHRLLTLEQRVERHEKIIESLEPRGQVRELEDRVQQLEREVTILQLQIKQLEHR